MIRNRHQMLWAKSTNYILYTMAVVVSITALMISPNAHAYSGICKQLQKAEAANPQVPPASMAFKMWDRLYRSYYAQTGRTTDLIVLSESAKLLGEPVPASAFLCPGTPAVVYLSHAAVELVLSEKKYPDDLLAFILAHELGHRFNDYNRTGSVQLKAFSRPGGGARDEEIADKSAALLIAVSGYSTRRLAREEIIDQFLSMEAHVRTIEREKRRSALLDILSAFDVYEDLYQLALDLIFTEKELFGRRILAWVDELMESGGIPLAEVKLARAHALMKAAAPYAPWLSEMRLPIDASSLRCKPIFPSHTAFWEPPRQYGLDRAIGKAEISRRMLLESRSLLEKAERVGADSFITANSQACVSFYLGDVGDAKRHYERAKKGIMKALPEPVDVAFISNSQLIAFLSALDSNPVPESRNKAQGRKWAKRFIKQTHRLRSNPQLKPVLVALAEFPSLENFVVEDQNNKNCHGVRKPSFDSKIIAVPFQISAVLGSCPSSWKLMYAVPFETGNGGSVSTVNLESPATVGISVCRNQVKTKLYKIRLPATGDSTNQYEDLLVLKTDLTHSDNTTLSEWLCACEKIRELGVMSGGERIFGGYCPELSVDKGAILVDDMGNIERALRIID